MSQKGTIQLTRKMMTVSHQDAENRGCGSYIRNGVQATSSINVANVRHKDDR